MKLLDKYILKTFLSTFFFVVLILLSIICVIDLTEKMDKYSRNNLTAEQVIGYYLDFLPWVGGLVAPITVFIATIYVCARMAGHTEIIAILSSGVSFRRMLWPFIMGATIVSFISFFFNGWLIPNSNKDRLAFEMQYLKSKYYFDKRNIHIQIASDTYLYMQNYNNTIHTGYHFSIEKFDSLRLIEKLTANRIEWDSTQQKWHLYDWRIRRMDGIFETVSYPERAHAFEAGSRRVITKDGLQQGEKMDTVLAINPKEFENDYRKYDGMTINELDEYITVLRSRGSTGVEAYEVELHTRFASPFSILILSAMAVIVSSRKSRGGTGVQIALGFVLAFIYILFFMLFRTYAEAGYMPTQISVWIPNLIFAAIAGAMYKYVPR